MKKKPLLALGLAFLMLSLLFSACGTQETPPPEQSDSTPPPPSSSEALPDGNVVEPSGLRFVTSAEEFDAQTVGTEDGFYYIDRSIAISANLRYIDYATAQDIYLSVHPEANHLTPEDDSYISSVAGMGEVFPDGDDLFLLRVGVMDSEEQLGKDSLPAIFRMNLDGTGREQLYSGTASEMLSTTAAVDDAYLYLISRRTETVDGTPESNSYLMRMDRETGETEDLCQIAYNARMIGASDGLLILHAISADSSEEMRTNNEIFAYEPATGKLAVLQSWPSEERAEAWVYQGKIVTASLTAHTVTVRDVRTPQETAVYPLPDSLPEDLSGFTFSACYDGRFVFWDYAAQKLHVLDLSTGQWGDMRLSYIDPSKNNPRPVHIWAENSSHFLVCYDRQLNTRRYLNPDDGLPYEREEYAPCYALIAKEDYWNSVPNYQTVTFNE